MKWYQYAALTGMAGVIAVGVAAPVSAQQFVRRLVAEFDYFDTETSTAAGVDPLDSENGGISIYERTVFVPFNTNVLYVTLATTGDTHGGVASCFSVLVDGEFANPGGQGAARCGQDGENVPGWIALLKLPEDVQDPDGTNNCDQGGGGSADCHDNAINYTWCAPIEQGTHTVQVRMAAAPDGEIVFIEQAHFLIDTNRIENGCEAAIGAEASALLEPEVEDESE